MKNEKRLVLIETDSAGQSLLTNYVNGIAGDTARYNPELDIPVPLNELVENFRVNGGLYSGQKNNSSL